MARPVDASPNPFVGYYSPDEPQTDIPTDAPGTIASQTPLIHPRDLLQPFSDGPLAIEQSTSARIARNLDAEVRQTELTVPHFNVLHDRLRTTQGWKHQIDALFEGSIAAPAAGASVTADILAVNPLGPGSPGQLIYPCISFCSIAAQGTALTGIFSVDALINGCVIPLGVYSGLNAEGALRSELVGSVPFSGTIDQQSAIGQVRISVLAGATVTSITFYVQIAVAFVYDYIRPLQDIRREQEAHSLHG